MEAVKEEIQKVAKDLAGTMGDMKKSLDEHGDVTKKLAEDFQKQEAVWNEKFSTLEGNQKKQAEVFDEFNKELGKKGFGGAIPEQHKELKDQIKEQFKSADWPSLEKNGQASISGNFVQKAVGVINTGNLTGGLNNEYRQGAVFEPRRPVHVRQLISNVQMSEPVFVFRRAKGKEGAVAYQTEGSTKAQIDYQFETKTLTAQTIAVFSVQTLQAVRDLNWLGSYVQDQMVEDLLLFEDDKLLNGAGGANDIEGIATVAQAYSPTDSGYNTYFEYLLDADAQLRSRNYVPNYHMIHPLAWAKMLLRKANTGEFDHPMLVFNGNLTLAGTQLVVTNALKSRFQFITGDFNRVTRMEREGISVALSYEDSDNFRKNLVTIRVEEAITQAIYNPLAFITGGFGVLGS